MSKAAWNAWILGFVAISALSRIEIWQECLLPGRVDLRRALDVGLHHPRNPLGRWDHWVVGFLIFIASLSSLSAIQREPPVDYGGGISPSTDATARTRDEPTRRR